jgi:Putative prokaryotic signal transducing protein
MELITIKTFDGAIEAHILRTRLESEGIQCFIFDENTVTMNPLFNFAVGGIKLKINESDREKALEIIESIEETPITGEDDVPIECPNCQSTDLYSGYRSMKGTWGFLSAIVSFFFMVFPIYYKTLYKCKECDTEFKIYSSENQSAKTDSNP